MIVKTVSTDIPSYCTFVVSKGSGEIYVVLGNCINDDDCTLWCAHWESGTHTQLDINDLQPAEPAGPDYPNVVARVESWAACGDEQAMFWLEWWYEGTNHPRSVWYYMAAIRKAPDAYGWVAGRVHSDAYYAATCRGVPVPDLAFLAEICEFCQVRGSLSGCARLDLGDWREALAKAQTATHEAWGFPAAARQLHKQWPWLPEAVREAAREGVDMCGDSDVWISAHHDCGPCDYDYPLGVDAYVITIRHRGWLAFKTLEEAKQCYLVLQSAGFEAQKQWVDQLECGSWFH